MRIQWKVIVLVLLVLTGTVSAVVWKTQSLLLEDKVNTITESNIKQMAPIRKLVDARLTEGKDRLVQFAAQRASGKSGTYGEFEVVSLVQPGDSGQWAPAWVEKGPEAKSGRWPQGYDLTLLKSLPYSKVRDGEVTWARLSDTQGSPIYALMVSVEIQGAGSVDVAHAPGAERSGEVLPETTDYGALAPAGSGRKAVVVGFASANPLAAVSEDYIGSINSVFVVDDKGYIASHNNRAYLGSLFSEDPIVKEIMKNQKATGTGSFEDLNSREVIGHFERIEHSNVYAVITTPMEAATGLVDAYTHTALVTGISVAVIGLLLAWVIGRSLSSQLERTIVAIQGINRGESIASLQPLHSKDEIGVLTQQLSEAFRKLSGEHGDSRNAESQASPEKMAVEPVKEADDEDPFAEMIKASRATNAAKAVPAGELPSERLADERRAAFEAFNEGFATAVKEPLLAILGHAQLARAKSSDAELKSHAESIEREARRAKEVIERFRDFDSEPSALPDTDRMNLEQVVRNALAKEEAALNAEEIDLVLDIKPVPETKGYAPQMEAALVHIIENAREAMANRSARKLMITLKDTGEDVFLEVADTGIGMSRDVKEKAFEPFFRGFENPRRMGLGLSLVQAALKRIDAFHEIESSPGEGTRFRMKFKVAKENRKAFDAEATVVAAFSEKAIPPMPAPSRPVETEASSELPGPSTSVQLASLESRPVSGLSFPPTPPPDPKREYVTDRKIETWAPKAPPPSIAMGMIEDEPTAEIETEIENEPVEQVRGDADDDGDIELSFRPISIQSPQSVPESTASSFDLNDIDDDDDDEMFTNVALNKAVGDLKAADMAMPDAASMRPPPAEPKKAPPPPPPAGASVDMNAAVVTGAAQAAGRDDFKVKIRRPKSSSGKN